MADVSAACWQKLLGADRLTMHMHESIVRNAHLLLGIVIVILYPT